MLWLQTTEGLVSVQQDPSPRATHPIRVVLVYTVHGGEEGPRESAYKDVDEANADLEYAGRESEDIALLMVEGAMPRDLGFDEAY